MSPSRARQLPSSAHAIGPNGSLTPRQGPHPAPNGSIQSPQHNIQLPHSPSRGISRLAPSPMAQPNSHAQGHGTTFVHYQPPGPLSGSHITSFNAQRPSSAHSAQSAFPSPIQNRPSMSPTQGNRDVGPLAGFPPSSNPQNGSVPATPFAQRHVHSNQTSPYAAPPSSHHTRPRSFSLSTPNSLMNSFQHSPPPSRYSQGQYMSGISPTKHSPAQPPASSGMGSATILPPIQKLEPSPKLMGRNSPDAPIPPPVKSMTPEQEDRARRENEMLAQQQRPPPASPGQQQAVHVEIKTSNSNHQ